MKHSLVIKFVVFLLTACSLMFAVIGGASIVAIESADLYVNSLDELQDQQYDTIARSIAGDYAELYAVKNYSNLTYTMRQDEYTDPSTRGDREFWTLELRQGDTILTEAKVTNVHTIVKKYTFTPMYPIVSLSSPNEATAPADPDITAPTEPAERSAAFGDTVVPQGYLYYDTRSVWEGTSRILYYYYFFEAPEYTVTVYMQPEVLESSPIHILTALYPLRYSAIALLACGLLLFAAGMGFLCWSAGRTKDGTTRPGGLNRLPLDLYVLILIFCEYWLLALFRTLWDWTQYSGPHLGNLSLLSINILVAIVVFIGFVFALAAQVKVKEAYWWHHSIVGFCFRKIWRGVLFCIRGITALVQLLPVIWQWLLIAFCMAASVLVTALLAPGGPFFRWLFLIALAASVITVCYGGYSFGILLAGVQKMSRGNLNHKIQTKYLRGNFLDFANQLNTLSEAAVLAAKRQTKSERMKTELITNVSHDIKTPLTSIINFVDLLQKPHSAKEGKEYLDVLSRQSTRMKKLIEDLMELSKASTGNLSAEIVPIDAAETVNQALGEFSDKLAAVDLTPVFRQPDAPVTILADGKLTWRVLSNLLSNAVKYAMPGTRLYIDLLRTDSQAVLSMKNISRQELNSNPEELMERFVQGDSSRNTEGSGLGLNIAASLMEVQKGRMHLTVDGDLFKVTLVFPSI
ncbi:MAG: HAMP domain-containing histidine kinase [Oscillospiraceae bacterium]|nr:HAMP domain-containing histidine kinase [Oscillospiraceae bacterium]